MVNLTITPKELAVLIDALEVAGEEYCRAGLPKSGKACYDLRDMLRVQFKKQVKARKR